MAQQRIATIEEELSGIKKLMGEVVNLTGKLGNETADAAKGIKGMEKATSSLAKGFKGVGLAIKAAGVGLLIEAFQVLKDLFMQNENVAAGFAAGMQFITSIFNDLVTLVTDHVVPVIAAVFEDPQQAIEDFGNLIKDNIIERFNSFLEVIESVGYGLGRLFSGDFEGFVDSMKNAGSEFVDVLTGVDNTLVKVGEVATKVYNGVANSIDKATKQAKQAFDLSKLSADIEIARARMEKLRFQYMKDAEVQRQIRDDQTKTIEERIEANNKLGSILVEQMEKEKEFLKLELSAAQTRANLNKQDRSLRAEVIRLETEMLDIEERITGQMSEQLVNQVGLRQEQAQMTQVMIDAENEARRIAMEGAAAREQNVFDRIELERMAAEETYRIQKEALDRIANDETLSQQDRANARAQALVLDAQYEQQSLNMARATADAKRDVTTQLFTQLAGIAEQGSDLAKGVAVAQATWNAYQAVVAALGATPYGPWNIAQAVATGAFGLAQVQKILATNVESGGGSMGGASIDGAPQPIPTTAVTGSILNPQAQIQATIDAPVRAYVVTKDVTSGQSADRNTIKNATLAPG